MDIKIKKVVFDIDDILWPLVDTVCDKLKIDINLITDFVIKDCYLLSQKQIDDITNMFKDVNTWNSMDFYKGAKDITKISRYGVEVVVNSNCMSQAIGDSKKAQINKHIDIPEKDVRCNVIQLHTVTKKPLDADTDVLVDDSPYNVAGSPAKLNIIINKPWNTSPKAKKIMQGKNIVRFNTLVEVNEFLDKLCNGEIKPTQKNV
jgi:hypothetical protein